ncbi:hypothetical protein ZWY2020_041301 [Hordeum vulgare]|nr:hypothetical protein ZWY2020_041301 [Hordeum vulgare]
MDSECRDLFFAAATRVFSGLHLHEPGFDLGSVIQPVPDEAFHSAVEAVKGPVEALVKRFICVAAPSSPDAAEADDEEGDTFDIHDESPEEGESGGSGSS